MPNVYVFHSYKLKEGASVQDFLLVADKLNSEAVSKQNGYISWTLLVDGEMWADIVIWESMDDFQNSAKTESTNPFVQEFLSFIDKTRITSHCFTVEKSY